MGFVPTKEYIEKTYNFEIDEAKIKEEVIKTKNIEKNSIKNDDNDKNLKPNKTAFKGSLKKPFDNIDASLNDDKFIDALKGVDIQKGIYEIIKNSKNYDEAYDEILKIMI